MDDGYVTLVNAKEENGVITETKQRTGMWAWKHPHHDGILTYTKLEGRVLQVQEKQRSPILSIVFMILQMVRFDTMGSIFGYYDAGDRWNRGFEKA